MTLPAMDESDVQDEYFRLRSNGKFADKSKFAKIIDSPDFLKALPAVRKRVFEMQSRLKELFNQRG